MTATAATGSSALLPRGRTVYLILAGLLIAAFAARLGVRIAFGEQSFWTDGYASFYRLAERIAATGAFCDGDRCPRPPLYPGFLALTALVARNYLLIVIPQAMIGAGTALMAFLIGREMFGARAGLIACALAAFYPYYVFHDTALQDTTFTTFTLALSVWLTLRADRSGHTADWLLAGLALGAALLTRASLAPTVALAVIWIAIAGAAPVARDRLRGALIATLTCFALLSPWLATTALHTGKASLSTDVGYELWVGNNPDTFSRFPQDSIDASTALARSRFTPQEREALRTSPANPRAADGWYGERARDYILGHPLDFAGNAARKVAIAFSWRITPYRSGPTQWVYAASYLPVALLGIAGMVMTWRRKTTWLVAALFAAFTGVTAVFSAQTSHRVHLDVYWMVFAAFALTAAVERLSGSTRPTLRPCPKHRENASCCPAPKGDGAMTITCCIRYVLDPFKRDAFEEYARRWLTIIPQCGGNLVGYFMPHEGTNNIAIALVSFDSLAAYESYRARITADADGAANLAFAARERFILSEERSFLRPVSA